MPGLAPPTSGRTGRDRGREDAISPRQKTQAGFQPDAGETAHIVACFERQLLGMERLDDNITYARDTWLFGLALTPLTGQPRHI